MNLFKIKDYELMFQWAKERNCPLIPFKILPKLGFVLEKKMIVFCIQTDSDFVMLEYLISDPNTSSQERQTLMNKYLPEIEDYVKKLGFRRIFISMNVNSVISLLKSSNYAEIQSVALIKEL